MGALQQVNGAIFASANSKLHILVPTAFQLHGDTLPKTSDACIRHEARARDEQLCRIQACRAKAMWSSDCLVSSDISVGSCETCWHGRGCTDEQSDAYQLPVVWSCAMQEDVLCLRLLAVQVL